MKKLPKPVLTILACLVLQGLSSVVYGFLYNMNFLDALFAGTAVIFFIGSTHFEIVLITFKFDIRTTLLIANIPLIIFSVLSMAIYLLFCWDLKKFEIFIALIVLLIIISPILWLCNK